MDLLALCHFLRGELRKVDAREQVRAFVGDAADEIFAASNQPDAALRRMGERIGALKRARALEPMDFRILDEQFSALAAMQAGCERIMGTNELLAGTHREFANARSHLGYRFAGVVKLLRVTRCHLTRLDHFIRHAGTDE